MLRHRLRNSTTVLASTAFALALSTSAFVETCWAQDQKPAQAIMGLQNPPPVHFKATADLPAGEVQSKATTACTECHEARIILQQRLSKAAWGKEVDKMTKWGAIVDPADRDALIDYLTSNFSPDIPPYEPQRTSTGKSNSGKTSK